MQKAVRDALVAFMAATAEARAEATKEAQRAGIAHAKATEPHRYRGRKPTFDRAQLELIRTCSRRTPARPPSRRWRGCRDRWSTGSRTIRRKRRRCWRTGGCGKWSCWYDVWEIVVPLVLGDGRLQP